MTSLFSSASAEVQARKGTHSHIRQTIRWHMIEAVRAPYKIGSTAYVSVTYGAALIIYPSCARVLNGTCKHHCPAVYSRFDMVYIWVSMVWYPSMRRRVPRSLFSPGLPTVFVSPETKNKQKPTSPPLTPPENNAEVSYVRTYEIWYLRMASSPRIWK